LRWLLHRVVLLTKALAPPDATRGDLHSTSPRKDIVLVCLIHHILHIVELRVNVIWIVNVAYAPLDLDLLRLATAPHLKGDCNGENDKNAHNESWNDN